MSRLSSLLRLDAKLAWEHKLVHVTVVVAAVFGALLRFAVPAEFGPDLGEFGLDIEGLDALAETTAAWASVTVLEPGASKPPVNQLLVAVLYALDLCILGFMFGSVMVLQDKEHGTVRYFRVSPGTGFDYVASKLLVNLGLSLLNFTILTGFAAPLALLEPALWLLIVLVCAGMTLVGMSLSMFLRNIAQWFFPMIVVSTLLALPTYLIVVQTPALAWTWWLPSYHILFGAEAIMFEGAATAPALAALAYAAVFCALTTLTCVPAVRGRLLREAR